MNEDTHGPASAIGDGEVDGMTVATSPRLAPEVSLAQLQTAIRAAVSRYGSGPLSVRVLDETTDAVMALLRNDGWIKDGVPPVVQVLADGQQFSDELVLTKLVARFFRVLILGGIVIVETPAAMEWLKDYIDGTHRVHGPLGKPMIWPGRLPSIVQLLRDWGFQPTATNPQYVSLRPGGAMLPATAPDPQAPDRASVPVLEDRRAANMGALLDEVVGHPGALALPRSVVLRAMSAAFDKGTTHTTDGFVVLSGDKLRYRTWVNGSPAWTEDLGEATRYARKEDADAVHAEDEDAWVVWPYTTAEAEQR